MLSRAARAIAVASVLVAGLGVAPRSEAASDPAGFIGELGNQAIQVSGPQIPEAQRAARFRQLFDRDFDLPDLARFVLGPAGRRLSPPQQQEFLALFRENLVQGYAKRLAEYAGEPFRVTGSRTVGDETIVTSQVQRRGGAPVEIDWHVAQRDGRLLVTDVAIDGVSQRVTERKEFAGIVERNGGQPDSLIAALRQQLQQDQTARTGASSPPAGMAPPPAAAGR
ncbi:MAG TPA: ABC transporter substrate-binding protein [Stellaceae bacterium]|nr:ABC transporter substrate-binding protein [Stellaceae bacterium]